MTLLVFKGFDLRNMFTDKYVGKPNTPLYADGNTPVPGKHLQVLFSTPQFQRKLEAPIRVLMRALNHTAAFKDTNMIPLWKSLTLMWPSDSRDFQEDARACASVEYYEEAGGLHCRLHIAKDIRDELKQDSESLNEFQGHEGAYYTIWEEAWYAQMYGNTLNEDKLEQGAKDALTAATPQLKPWESKGKGSKGKGKHWASAVIHCDAGDPFPIPMTFKAYGDGCPDAAVPFDWNEYCQKMKKPEEKVGEGVALTLQGKPADLSSASATAAAPATPTPPKAPPDAVLKGKGKSNAKG